MPDNKLTYEEYMAYALRDVPADQQAQWLESNTIQSAPDQAEGWAIMPKDRNLPNYRNLDDFQDYEHAREIE
ncbi:hypothetical protein [Adhaeribacter pallidiroseus]|uniref:Uncharacterized protein n=1 Tax=Adhaeribacter pallidiroseus TaxID=2072847 RepID=A0A369QL18_9BACT|nr:hypothetical protein [Adhaeribacter pallidiroseus]RDC64345.1 hypothetical protein AHMF7616_02958 [Adhaeribacter pallidiroseus]